MTRFERSARFWLRAYPRRWRNQHGEEFLAVLADLYGLPDDAVAASRLPLAEVLGLLRAGWGLRWRERPPFWRWLLYRLLDRRLPERYWWWVVDDIQGPLFFLRYRGPNIGVVLVLVLWQASMFAASPARLPSWYYVVVLSGLVLSIFLTRRILVRQAWRRHVLKGNIPPSMRPAAAA